MNILNGDMNVHTFHGATPSCGNFRALAPRGLAGYRRHALFWCASAAVFRQEAEQRVHGLEARGIDHRAALTAYRDQAGLAQSIEMEREGVWGQVERARHGA